jgi:hypothetical protein
MNNSSAVARFCSGISAAQSSLQSLASDDQTLPGTLTPSGAAHIIPAFTSTPGTKYPWRTAVKLLPSDEHEVSIESFLGIARHQIASLLDKSGMLDQSEKSRVNTTLAWRWRSKNSVPHFVQFSAFCRTAHPRKACKKFTVDSDILKLQYFVY